MGLNLSKSVVDRNFRAQKTKSALEGSKDKSWWAEEKLKCRADKCGSKTNKRIQRKGHPVRSPALPSAKFK